ncbi:glycerol-3-phosphate dehydrogenase [Devosia sp. UYZn731]|uniref:glycerol-3-phosphate dehydrogenase/oxidase n=1 Tax=Devosia sp. UYZn731 TaxID=3156345 RepID=UPI003396A200
MIRPETIARLKDRPGTTVLVIGGGINGISVFRELALNGIDVVLADKDDFCSGASAALSRMVHGGLRYLENGEFKLVRESLLERDRLLANAPHFVRPLPTTVPIFDTFAGLAHGALRFLGLTRRQGRRGAVVIKTGLTLYDFFTGGRRVLPPHQFHGRRNTVRRWPAMNPAVRASATYFDAWVSRPERLGIEMLQEGIAAGGLALNHAAVVRTNDGLMLRDAIGGEDIPVAPDLVINATGGWIDLTNVEIGATSQKLMGGTKGSHLVIANRALSEALDGHMIYYENEDGRICIAFPYLGNVLVGSTDVRVDNPDTVRWEAEEQAYILASLAVVFPSIAIAPAEIVFQFAGVRPLPTSDAAVTGSIPRDHFCEVIEGEPPVLCMIGGKWTTFRSFGAMAADMVFDRLGHARTVDTENLPIGGGKDFPDEPAAWIAATARRTGLSTSRVAALLDRYGSAAGSMAEIAGSSDDIAGHSRAELEFLVTSEHVETLADLLLRRTTIAITGALSLRVIDTCLALLAEAKGWSPSKCETARDAFLAELLTRHGLDRATLVSRDQRTIA